MYVTETLVGANIEDVKLKKIIDAVRNIRVLVKNVAKQVESTAVRLPCRRLPKLHDKV